MVRALEEQPEVALQLAVIGREDHVDVVAPAAPGDRAQHSAEGLVDQFALDGVAGVDLADLIGGERGGHPVGRGLVVRDQAPVVPRPPVAGLGVEYGLALARTSAMYPAGSGTSCQSTRASSDPGGSHG